jgi:hypothetical protein
MMRTRKGRREGRQRKEEEANGHYWKVMIMSRKSRGGKREREMKERKRERRKVGRKGGGTMI